MREERGGQGKEEKGKAGRRWKRGREHNKEGRHWGSEMAGASQPSASRLLHLLPILLELRSTDDRRESNKVSQFKP